MSPNVINRPLTPADFPAISRLHAKVFGPGRFTRTAYRVREGSAALSPYCRVALLGEPLIAAVRFTPITIGGVDGALLLGPLAVDPDFAGQGFGRRLIGEAMEAAKADGVQARRPGRRRALLRPLRLSAGAPGADHAAGSGRSAAVCSRPSWQAGALAAFSGAHRRATRVMTRA